MLRRTESVVEKFLTNWLSICMYSHLKVSIAKYHLLKSYSIVILGMKSAIIVSLFHAKVKINDIVAIPSVIKGSVQS